MSQNNRKKTRRYLIQKLYARIYGELDEARFHESYFNGILDFDLDSDYLDSMYKCIIENNNTILEIIEGYAPKFDILAMQKIQVIIMCVSVCEMLFIPEEIPGKVSINEAIENSKYFWDDSSKNIVNGILNKVFTNFEEHQKSLKNYSKNYQFFLG